MGLMASPHAACWLFAVAFAESSFFPIPPDPMLAAMGISASETQPGMVFAYAALCTAGSVLGGAAGYAIGLYGGRPLAVRIFGVEKVNAAENTYRRYDAWAIAAAGFTPIPYKVFTILSGALEVRFWKFVWISALSRGARFFLVAALIRLFGRDVKRFLDVHFAWLTVLLFAAVIIGFTAAAYWAKIRGDVTSGEDGGRNPS